MAESPASATVTVRLFGRLADQFGRELNLPVTDDCCVGEVRRGVGMPEGKVRACIGDNMVTDAHPVRAGDEVEFFPPVSGG